MNEFIISNTIKLLEIEPDFILKDATAYSAALTVYDCISKIILDGGENNLVNIFKGHCILLIRPSLANLFMDYPKPSISTPWYGHILSLNNLKKCPACNNIKALSEFSKNKAMKSSGIDSWCRDCTKEYRDINSDKIKTLKSLHQKANSAQYAHSSAKRRAQKLNATPSWANLNQIKQIYLQCPKGYQVDHIIPLQGELVSGLHVESNLQYLKPEDNLSKGNRFIP